LAILVNPRTRDLVYAHPHVDIILVDDQPRHHKGVRGFFRLVSALKRHKFDVAILLHPTLRLALATFMARIPNRIGTAYRAYSMLFNQRVRHHRKGATRHEVICNLELLAPLGVQNVEPEFHLNISDEAFRKVDLLLASLGVDPTQPFVVLHPGTGGSARNWRPEAFGALARRLTQEIGFEVVVTGSPAESALADQVVAAANGRPVSVAGRLNTIELAALLRRAQVVVANSTGPLHLAVAVGTEVVGLYAPLRPIRPERWGPFGRPRSVIMSRSEDCTACKRSRSLYCLCMDRITVDSVLNAVLLRIERPRQAVV
jgi:ADP-heptose:LPS heptosyltransferase